MGVARSFMARLPFGAGPRLPNVLQDEARLAKLAGRLGVALVLVLIAFVAFYVYDRYVVMVESPVDEAVRTLEDRVRKSPNDPELRLQVANGYARQGRNDEAITQYGEALKLRANWQPALLAMAGVELARGNQRRTEEIYLQIVEMNRDNDFRYANRNLQVVYYRLGLFASQAGRHPEAAEWAREALRVDRSDADALFLLASSEEAQGNLGAARAAYRQATAFDPNFREALGALSRTAAAEGDPREAAYARGMELLAAGDVDGSLAEFSRLVAEAPDYGEAYQGLGLAYGKKGQRDEAIQAFRAALERNPELLLSQWSLRAVETGR